MAKHFFLPPPATRRNDGWEALAASVDELVRRRPEGAQQANTGQPKPVLRERTDHGVCAVPIYRIALGTYPEPPFERWLTQYTPATPKPQPDDQTQPVQLYKVGETYFVRGGDHRIATARSRSQLFLRAHVVEYTGEAPNRAADVLHLLIAQERADFFSRLPFPLSHPIHGCAASTLGTFDTLAVQIEQARPALGQLGLGDEQTLFIEWYERVYLPIVRLVRRRHLLAYFPACTEVDLFLWAVNRDGPWANNQALSDRMRLARHNIASLWVALQTQHAPRT